MERCLGTVVRGLRAPIIRQGDDLVNIVADVVMNAASQENIELKDKDVVAITEAVVARAQNNYATIEQITADVKSKMKADTIGLIFPIMSRNRFAICLKGLAAAAKKVVILMKYPADEVGNQLISWDDIDNANLNPDSDILTLAEYRQHFGETKHLFTGVDYVTYYQELVTSLGVEVEFVFGNQPEAILPYAKHIICCDIHSRKRSQKRLLKAGAEQVLLLTDILNAECNGSGFHPQYGLLGSNKAGEERIKLFPKDGQDFVDKLQQELLTRSKLKLEVMIYGDGAFKDPVGHIWELADPVVSPAYTRGLEGTPNEVKLKYLADNHFASLKGQDLKDAISNYILNKNSDLKGQMDSQGTTPRQLTDLIGSLCDLTSGSGDKGTPIILIQGYFDNFAQD